MSKIRVVLIEDHELTRMGFRTALQQSHEIEWVGEATNGSDGLSLLETVKPDVGIVDIGLPDMDGIELTRRFQNIKEHQQDNSTKILILTLQGNEETVMAALAAGANSYCIKTVNRDQLLKAIKLTHRGDVWLDPEIAKTVLKHASLTQAQPEIAAAKETAPIQASISESSPLISACPLTEKELAVLQFIIEGYDNDMIAKRLDIPVEIVQVYVRNVLEKLRGDGSTQSAVQAIRSGLM
ncbi:response regulator [Coleofasciculus sp.]|uniref:response regulator n=1 Tax=Coleofasciculus sp. TaxID=3100458 RepID=UPI0039FA5272